MGVSEKEPIGQIDGQPFVFEQVLLDLLELWGQGGSGSQASNEEELYHCNSFVIADQEEGWVVDAAGKWWAAENIEAGEIRVMYACVVLSSLHKSLLGGKLVALLTL